MTASNLYRFSSIVLHPVALLILCTMFIACGSGSPTDPTSPADPNVPNNGGGNTTQTGNVINIDGDGYSNLKVLPAMNSALMGPLTTGIYFYGSTSGSSPVSLSLNLSSSVPVRGEYQWLPPTYNQASITIGNSTNSYVGTSGVTTVTDFDSRTGRLRGTFRGTFRAFLESNRSIEVNGSFDVIATY